jgi:hypothetical protein
VFANQNKPIPSKTGELNHLSPLKEEFLEKLTMHCSNGSNKDQKEPKLFA